MDAVTYLTVLTFIRLVIPLLTMLVIGSAIQHYASRQGYQL